MAQGLLEIETDGRHDVLVWRQTLRNHVGVEDDVAAEDNAAAASVYHVHGAAEWNEDPNKARHHCHRTLRRDDDKTKGMIILKATKPPKSHPPMLEKSY